MDSVLSEGKLYLDTRATLPSKVRIRIKGNNTTWMVVYFYGVTRNIAIHNSEAGTVLRKTGQTLVSEEFDALIEAVCKHKHLGPWRQIVDWLQNHYDELPKSFQKALTWFLEESTK